MFTVLPVVFVIGRFMVSKKFRGYISNLRGRGDPSRTYTTPVSPLWSCTTTQALHILVPSCI